jgi:S1-C subfamily serine protease
LLVVWLEDGGPAASGGVLVGDIIIGIAGKKVSDPDDIFAALTGDTIAKPVEVRIARGGRIQSLRVAVGERK